MVDPAAGITTEPSAVRCVGNERAETGHAEDCRDDAVLHLKVSARRPRPD
jgi:hypothetical protein